MSKSIAIHYSTLTHQALNYQLLIFSFSLNYFILPPCDSTPSSSFLSPPSARPKAAVRIALSLSGECALSPQPQTSASAHIPQPSVPLELGSKTKLSLSQGRVIAPATASVACRYGV